MRTSDGRQHASIGIDKWPALVRSSLLSNKPRDIAALLYRDGSEALQRLPVRIDTMCGISDDKDPGFARNRQVCSNLDPTGLVLRNCERVQKRRRPVACSPDDIRRSNELASDHHAIGPDLTHQALQPNCDTLAFKRVRRFGRQVRAEP